MAEKKRDELGELLDKQAITEVIYRYCRGIDRMDRELTLSCWHPDGTADYGVLFAGLGSGFVEWIWPVHAEMEHTQHTIKNILIEVEGDKAASESYFIVYLRVKNDEGTFDIIGTGRYVDHFERRSDLWKISHRQVVYDWNRTEKVTSHFPVSTAIPPNNPAGTTLRGMRNREDYSYRALKRVYG
ncbi:nuclear transport factor 2 family protein [Thermodesulfobacteriota bacterium]